MILRTLGKCCLLFTTTIASLALSMTVGSGVAHALPACGGLNPDDQIHYGESISSCNGAFTWKIGDDRNFIALRNSDGYVVWAAGINGKGTDRCQMELGGNLVCYAGGTLVWESGTKNKPNFRLALQDDGLMVVRGPYGSANETVAWDNKKRLPYDSQVIGKWSDTSSTRIVAIGADGYVSSYCTQSLYLNQEGTNIFYGRTSAGGCYNGKPTGSYEEKWTLSGDSASVNWINRSGLESQNYKVTNGTFNYQRVR
ncbi:hypothetical protein [Amycolatopsis sp. NPDC004378]